MLELIESWSEKRSDGRGTRVKGLYRCHCGAPFEALRENVQSGNTARCKDCANKSRAKKRRKHGHSFRSATSKLEYKCYYTWQAMKRRCTKEYDKRYENYGGRGIKICQAWLDSYESFLEDMGLPPSMAHSIERVDVNGNYEPSNCMWLEMSEQAANRSNNRSITAFGKTQNLADWERETGIAREKIAGRLNRGWEPEAALNPKNANELAKYRTPDGDFGSLGKLAEHYGMSTSGAYGRINSKAYPDWFKL